MFRLTIILILLSVYTEQGSGGSFFLYNQVRHGVLMKVHCKSGDSDRGWHVRKYGGFYGFDFKDHILDKTLYWCNVWSGPNFSRNASFVAYESKQDVYLIYVACYIHVRHGSLMKVHCKSKDNDMGWHVRKYGGVYGFDFNDNLFGTTLFWCNIWQGPHLEHFQVIVAFESRQYPHDLNAWIRWSVRGDGIYQSINGATWKFKYHWDNKL
ncbi:unnamed protein product [Brassica rapa subsp. trilocularis]